jgi:hypothetical protein
MVDVVPGGARIVGAPKLGCENAVGGPNASGAQAGPLPKKDLTRSRVR